MQRAPFYDDVAEGPGKGQAFWIETVDRLKLRAGGWFSEGHSQNGTIFRFPGRGDFLEGSGQIARAFAKFGYGTVANDWRGQGASDRLLKDPYVGHVTDFMDYQKDVRAIFDMARQLELPKPWFVLGSSMGACIALRSLYDAPPISAVIFSAPMWGINLKMWQRRLALPLSRVVHTLVWGTYMLWDKSLRLLSVSHPLKRTILHKVEKDMLRLSRGQSYTLIFISEG